MFPGPSATVYTNDAGEILGWSYESYDPADNDDPYDLYDDRWADYEDDDEDT